MSEHEISQDILIAEYEAVYYYVLSLCHNSSEAEDITQETFCRALYKRRSSRGIPVFIRGCVPLPEISG